MVVLRHTSMATAGVFKSRSSSISFFSFSSLLSRMKKYANFSSTFVKGRSMAVATILKMLCTIATPTGSMVCSVMVRWKTQLIRKKIGSSTSVPMQLNMNCCYTLCTLIDTDTGDQCCYTSSDILSHNNRNCHAIGNLSGHGKRL